MAPADFTGYWAAVITEDWRFRMVTPPKGDAAGIPLNDAGQKAANAWDPQKDIAAGEQCRAFGAGGVMRMPIRLRVSWQDDTTLKFETDNGQQVRLFRFGAVAAGRRRAAVAGSVGRVVGDGRRGPRHRAGGRWRRRPRRRSEPGDCSSVDR